MVVVEETRQDLPVHGLRVEDASGRVVLDPPDRWDPRHRLLMVWDNADRVWVYSADVGTYIWSRSASGWSKRPYANSGLTAPEALQSAVPGRFR